MSNLESVDQLADLQSLRWHSTPGLPPGANALAEESDLFRMTEKGVIYVGEESSIRVCSRLVVKAEARDPRSENWRLLIELDDPDGKVHQLFVPRELLIGDGDEAVRLLVSHGLRLPVGRKARGLLIRYLSEASCARRVRVVQKVGWTGDVFTLPSESFGPQDETTVYESQSGQETFFDASGSLEDWQAEIGRYCIGNSRLLLAVSTAFAAPLLNITGDESGGIHFVGPSSMGKTTTLRAASSVIGGPAARVIQSWRATSNGLEAVAEAHNDFTIPLDELGQMDPKEASEVAYMLANGAGKSRAQRTGGARRRARWRLLILSTGEVSLSDHLAEAGKRTKAGQEVRLVNVPADPGAGLGVFQCLHGFSDPRLLADHLAEATGKIYGVPIRHYLRRLVSQREIVARAVEAARSQFIKENVPEGASGQVKRVASRFGLIASAGELATEYGITGWKPSDAYSGASECFRGWLSLRGGAGDGEVSALLAQVRAFIEAHGEARFVQVDDTHTRTDIRTAVINMAGHRRKGIDGCTEWLIFPETFRKEVCRGYRPEYAASSLAAAGVLRVSDDGKTSVSFWRPDVGKSARAYCITSAVFEEQT